MKRLLILTIVFCLVVGCCPCRKISSVAADSVRIETVVRTEFVKDTVYIDVPFERQSQVVPDSSHLETNFAVSDARILVNGQLYHSLENKAQKRPVEAQARIEYRDSIVYRDRVQCETVEVERALTEWQRLQMTGFWVFFVIFVCIIGCKLYFVIRHGI